MFIVAKTINKPSIQAKSQNKRRTFLSVFVLFLTLMCHSTIYDAEHQFMERSENLCNLLQFIKKSGDCATLFVF
jgi:hypothetical protein